MSQLSLLPCCDQELSSSFSNEYLRALGFVPQYFENDWNDVIAYNGFLIMPESPNGSMTILSVMHEYSAEWWSIQTDMHKFCPDLPDFDYHETEEAIAWAKTKIDELILKSWGK